MKNFLYFLVGVLFCPDTPIQRHNQKNQELAKIEGETLAEIRKARTKLKKACSHRKGGFVKEDGTLDCSVTAITDINYSVIKHKYPWGDIWVRCIRCGTIWKPGDEGYEEALAFPTHNKTSTSLQFGSHNKYKHAQFVADVREKMVNTE